MGRTRLTVEWYTEHRRPKRNRNGPKRKQAPRSSDARGPEAFGWLLADEALETLLDPAGVRALGASQGLEPLGNLLEAFLARRLGEPRVHLRVLVGLAGDRRLEVLLAVADRLAGCRIADALQ